jgi:uncharacterized GH25 family protein
MMQRARRSSGKSIATAICVIEVCAGVARAHDLFLRADSFFVPPNSIVRLRALSGTFSESENSVSRDRLRDLSVVSASGRSHPDTMQWSATGDTSVLSVRVGSAGTYVVGASLRPREITLKAKEFNAYLADDGIPEVLATRKKKNELNKDATERYSKHIKALVQAGSARTGDFSAVLDYPAEIIPLDNPYSLGRGSTLRVRALVDGKTVANQTVVAGGRSPTGARFREQRVRTNASGVARIHLAGKGQWYVKFLRMVPFTGSERIDYESKWATLTFELNR